MVNEGDERLARIVRLESYSDAFDIDTHCVTELKIDDFKLYCNKTCGRQNDFLNFLFVENCD